jgi:type I restriction enzyme S subunit
MALGLPIPLPPLAEQHRIVAKVDELMALCDQLEAAQKAREARRDGLRAASLHVMTSTDGDGLAASAEVQFFLLRSQRMITKPEHVAAVRQTVLDLAVRGRLVPQDPTDAPVSDSLRASDQVRLETSLRDRRASAECQELLGTDLQWTVPTEWGWRGLADLALFIDYRGKTPTKGAGGIRLITAKNVRPRHLSLDPEEFISEPDYVRWMTRGLPEMGDVLFTTEAPLGNATVVRLTERFALAQRVIDFRPYGAIDPDFLVLQLTAPPFQRILEQTATGLTAKGIKAAKLKRLPLAVPPSLSNTGSS